jgi:hypothetical protein
MQIFADFDFIDVTGVIRFVKPDQGNALGTAQAPSNRALKEAVVYEEDSDRSESGENEDEDVTSDEDDFNILAHLGPSQEVPD